LRSSIINSGLDPDNLAAGSLDTMKFGSDGSSKAKAWRDIWGSGQGIGVIDKVRPASEFVDLLAEQYAAAKARICAS
jgi:nitronate monooxygenase